LELGEHSRDLSFYKARLVLRAPLLVYGPSIELMTSVPSEAIDSFFVRTPYASPEVPITLLFSRF
jgi:hypothetical protein